MSPLIDLSWVNRPTTSRERESRTAARPYPGIISLFSAGSFPPGASASQSGIIEKRRSSEKESAFLSASPKVLAINGSYREGGIIDQALDEILTAAREEGAETGKVLPDRKTGRILYELPGLHQAVRPPKGNLRSR